MRTCFFLKSVATCFFTCSCCLVSCVGSSAGGLQERDASKDLLVDTSVLKADEEGVYDSDAKPVTIVRFSRRYAVFVATALVAAALVVAVVFYAESSYKASGVLMAPAVPNCCADGVQSGRGALASADSRGVLAGADSRTLWSATFGRELRDGSGPRCKPGDRSHNRHLVQEIASRKELGPMLDSMHLTGDGAALGVKQGNFAEEMLSGWKGGAKYHLVDPWVHQAEYVDLANVPDAQHNAYRSEALSRTARFGKILSRI